MRNAMPVLSGHRDSDRYRNEGSIVAIRGDIGGNLRREARERGDIKYFTGQPCKHGHVSGRLVSSGHCDRCASIRAGKSHKKARHGPNGDEVRAKHLAMRNRWLLKPGSREMVLAGTARWSVNYRLDHPIEYRVYTANQRAKKFAGIGLPGLLLLQEVYELLEKQKYKCAECFDPLKKNFHLDHKMPLSRGGPNKIENIQGLCAPCNAAKHCADHLEWARIKGRLL